ncbi:MAG: hypothetical protein K9W46_13665 [Candidatus Heimdallarchaeum endolithica]|uniref:Histone deacetylase domain-containing protein n=1 Tax=Candidatus Heimdallarchaeum endolithica TaxID=2876572 RepID=A0A9Y1BQK9_9ARCH|nr:MAG: hypothetical protein K9W46_13665 [Candidatus Heimdallarchaeum endolithica]
MYNLITLSNEEMKKHVMDPQHPEKPQRLDKFIQGFNIFSERNNFKCKFVKSEKIIEEDLLLVHDLHLINVVKSISLQGGGVITWDNVLNKHTFSAACYAAGASKQAAELVSNNETEKAFAIVRPPGHHTNSSTVAGFCFFNNIAIIAETLVSKGFSKIAIVDIDQHFGNGTADIFYSRNDVLYYSIHAHPAYAYPGRGYPFESGIYDGMGYTVNCPVLPKTNTQNWVYTFQQSIKVLEQFKPEIILVSLGFDGLETDPVGMLNLKVEAFQSAGFILSEIAEKYSKKRIIAVTEGGYDLNNLSSCTNSFLRGIMGIKPKILSYQDNWKIHKSTRKQISIFKKHLSSFWDF